MFGCSFIEFTKNVLYWDVKCWSYRPALSSIVSTYLSIHTHRIHLYIYIQYLPTVSINLSTVSMYHIPIYLYSIYIFTVSIHHLFINPSIYRGISIVCIYSAYLSIHSIYHRSTVYLSIVSIYPQFLLFIYLVSIIYII